jgi:hypothetical protein
MAASSAERRWSKEPRMATMPSVFPWLLCSESRSMVARRVSVSIVRGSAATDIVASDSEITRVPPDRGRGGEISTGMRARALRGGSPSPDAGRGREGSFGAKVVEEGLGRGGNGGEARFGWVGSSATTWLCRRGEERREEENGSNGTRVSEIRARVDLGRRGWVGCTE